MKKISVIIPAYNEEKYIEKTLDSINNQSFRDIETIVVDNGSTDNTSKSSYSADEVLRFTDLYNPSAARNYGARNSKGEYLVFLDADSTLSKNAIKNAKKSLDEGYVGGTCIVESPDKSFASQFQMSILNNWARYINVQYTPFIYCSREAFEKSKGWPEGKELGDDLAFQRRLKKHGKLYLDEQSFVETSPRRYHKEGFLKITFLGLLGYYGADIKWWHERNKK